MKIFNHIHVSLPFSLKLKGMLLILAASASLYARAQLVIGGNVYGGGDMGNVGGSSSVKVISGVIGTEDIDNPGGSVFGGARMADVGGNASVFIDGETEGATDYVLINRVYGGNDIAGHIGTAKNYPEGIDTVGAREEGIDNTWNSFVRISNAKSEDSDIKKIFIGQLFGGGNGEYEYIDEVSATDPQTEEKTYTHTIKEISKETAGGDTIPGALITTITDKAPSAKPVLGKTFVDIHGGSIVYAYAGGNNVTVTENASICVENESQIVGSIKVNENWKELDDEGTELITENRLKAMGINLLLSSPTAQSAEDFQIGRLFGGNNLAEMSIRPTWHLKAGSIRNVYSGGNCGNMTNPEGLLLTIPEESTIRIDNLYGGCRMADVRPQLDGEDVKIIQIKQEDMSFPAGLSARLVVFGGDVNNVYGGNDVTGQVYGGNAVGIYTSIRGSVYGGGNGSYPYTDNEKLKNHDIYGDLYYNPDAVLTKAGITIPEGDEGLKSVTALNAFRPDAEQVSIHLIGKTVKDSHNQDSIVPTIIGGSVYLGGNSATLEPQILDEEPG